jgi:hypothetical protein
MMRIQTRMHRCALGAYSSSVRQPHRGATLCDRCATQPSPIAKGCPLMKNRHIAYSGVLSVGKHLTLERAVLELRVLAVLYARIRTEAAATREALWGRTRRAPRPTVHKKKRRPLALGVHDGVTHLHAPPLPVHSLSPLGAPRDGRSHRGTHSAWFAQTLREESPDSIRCCHRAQRLEVARTQRARCSRRKRRRARERRKQRQPRVGHLSHSGFCAGIGVQHT